MDEQGIREAIRTVLIDQQAVEHELTLTFVGSLLRMAYGLGYSEALAEPEPDFEETAKATTACFCRLPV